MALFEKGSPLRRMSGILAVSAAALLLAGVVTMPLERRAWAEVSRNFPETNLASLEGALGQGVVLGVLGGFRTLVADLMFIRLNDFWVERDMAKVESFLPLVTNIDPRPLFFWLNGARMIAYDIPIWRIEALGEKMDPGANPMAVVPEPVKQRIFHEQARKSLAVLENALEFHPGSARIYQEFASINLHKLEDRGAAAEWFLKAWRAPGGKYFHGRIHAELLRQMGRNEEAYAFLREHYEEIPKDLPEAQSAVVLERIRELEETLGIPAGERFEPSEMPGEGTD